MNTWNELVYVEVEIYHIGETEYTDVLNEYEFDLWAYPTRPGVNTLSDVISTADDEMSVFTDLALRITPITLHNPAFMATEWKSYIDMLIEESNADLIDVFGVDANELWLPVIQRHMQSLPFANRVGFYAVYVVTESSTEDEHGKEVSFEFNYAGELDIVQLTLVQS